MSLENNRGYKERNFCPPEALLRMCQTRGRVLIDTGQKYDSAQLLAKDDAVTLLRGDDKRLYVIPNEPNEERR